MFSIQPEPFSPCAAALIEALDSWQNALYPVESQYCTDLTALQDDELILVMARDAQGRAAGCVSLLIQPEGCGELKRMYVAPEYRGQKLAERLIAAIERQARQAEIALLRLETGVHHHTAIRLYERLGYRRCDPFPPYGNDPFGVYMAKPLALSTSSSAPSRCESTR